MSSKKKNLRTKVIFPCIPECKEELVFLLNTFNYELKKLDCKPICISDHVRTEIYCAPRKCISVFNRILNDNPVIMNPFIHIGYCEDNVFKPSLMLGWIIFNDYVKAEKNPPYIVVLSKEKSLNFTHGKKVKIKHMFKHPKHTPLITVNRKGDFLGWSIIRGEWVYPLIDIGLYYRVGH